MISSRAPALIIIVIRNSTSPNSISALRYKSPVASVNSLAITAAIVYPGANREALMCGSFPITIVTAMVSPRARAKARKIEPMMPSRAYGTTTCQVDSHFVAPSARAASRCSRGTSSRASREIEMMNGKVMIARIRPAARNP